MPWRSRGVVHNLSTLIEYAKSAKEAVCHAVVAVELNTYTLQCRGLHDANASGYYVGASRTSSRIVGADDSPAAKLMAR